MNLTNLLPAPHAILADPGGVDLRGEAYLRTYPHIVNAVTQPWPPADLFQVASCLAYGWMPRTLRIDPARFLGACLAYDQAMAATLHNWHAVNLADMAGCLRSVVGASKVAHFCNPDVFPIWDSNVERFRVQANVGNGHMRNLQNYIDYATEVHAIAADPGFPAFSANLIHAFHTRLAHLHIPVYPIGPLRVIDIAAFELA